MARVTSFSRTIFSLTLVGLLSFGSLAPALAATVTDTFQLTMTGTERCRDNPKFVEAISVKAAGGMTLTFLRDGTVMQATLDTKGAYPTIESITFHGRVLPANKLGSSAQLVLSGRDPGNPDHFMTLRGIATFDKTGNLIKVTGTFVSQITGTYTIDKKTGAQSPSTDCFDNGTFGTRQKAVPRNFTVDATSSYTLFQQTSLWINGFALAVAYGDFDQDGDLDVVRANASGTPNPSPVERYLNNGSGVFSLDTTWFGGTPPGMIHPRKALSGDFNGDGKLDVFILGHGYDQPPFPGEAPVLILSSPGGEVIAPGLNNLIGFHHGGAAADIDADGDLDVFVSSGTFLINNGQGQFTVDTTRIGSDLVSRQLYSAELVDVDRDGYVDLLVGGHEQDGMSTYICWGDSTGFYSAAKSTTIAAVPNEGVVLDFDAEDIDGDGDRDLVVTRTGDGKGTLGFYQGYYLQILENVGNRQFTDQTAQKIVAGSDSSAAWFPWIRLHDQNGDGHLDIVVTNRTRNLVWHYDPVSGQFTR